MVTGYVTHDEAMIKSFMEDPLYADELLADVLNDGSDYEIQRIQSWYDEAQKRLRKATAEKSYWYKLTENVKHRVNNCVNWIFDTS